MTEQSVKRTLTLDERWALQRAKDDAKQAEVIRRAYEPGADPLLQTYTTVARLLRYGTDAEQHKALDETGIPREA